VTQPQADRFARAEFCSDLVVLFSTHFVRIERTSNARVGAPPRLYSPSSFHAVCCAVAAVVATARGRLRVSLRVTNCLFGNLSHFHDCSCAAGCVDLAGRFACGVSRDRNAMLVCVFNNAQKENDVEAYI
jgi:hypothetical protein